MFGNIGVDLHLSTKLVLSFYWWALPLVFGGAVVLIIGKQFFVRDKWISLTLTLAVTVVIAVVSNVITRALYRPFFDLVDKLSK
jgi:membrane protein YdbS with pleckstrin-like domain